MTSEIKQRIEQIRNGEVPKGYKHSKFGIIPKDWEVMRLKDKFDRLSRKNSEGNTNVLTISAQYGLINQEEFFKKEIASDDKSNYYLLHRGEFAYNKSYSNGYPFGAIKRLSRYDKGVVSPLYSCFSANSNNACPEYYEQYFEAGRLNHEIQAYAQEGARNHGLLNISVIDFFNSKIIVPPIAEQKRIAKILSTQDKVIECYEKKIEQFKQMKKYYLQNMFPKRGETVPKIRFKGFTDPWEQRKVRDVSEIVAGGTPNTSIDKYWEPKEIPWLASGEVHKKIITFTDDMISKEGMNNSSAKLIKEKSLLIALAGQGKTRGTVAINHIPLTTNQSIAAMTFINDIVPEFVFCNLENRYDEIRRMSSGDGSRGGLNKQIVGNIEIPYTSKSEQELVGKFFTHFDNLITLHQRKLEEEKKKKKALQQLLLTGIVRTN